MTIVLTLPDGSERTVPAGTTALEVAQSIGPRLAQDAVGAELAGRRIDLREPLTAGGSFADKLDFCDAATSCTSDLGNSKCVEICGSLANLEVAP